MNGRRAFLGAAGALALAACTRGPALPPGELLSTSHALGHRLRDGGLPAAGEVRKARVVVVGAGIGGLAAAWWLARAGVRDVEILELEASAGGNARWGENAVTRYPWGAHYIALPPREARTTRLLLADLGILEGDVDAAHPRYDERALCHAPQERLYRNGTWEEGLSPISGRSPAELAEWHRFTERMRDFGRLRGDDGRRAFAVPLDQSSRDAALMALDRVTMEAWLRAEGFTTEAVHWSVNYACRDDYGTDYREVSAWAGLHYFASRSEAHRESEQEAVLTWPEGNGRIVRALLERHGFALSPRTLVHRIEEGPAGVRVLAWQADQRRGIAFDAQHVVWAAPLGFAARALAGPAPLVEALRSYDYAPWLVANVALAEPPYAHHGAPLSWDNVLFDSAALGYVVATHQSLASRPGPTVLTWYLPLTSEAPAAARRRLLETPRERWAEAALADLARPHPEIRRIAQRVDVFANGHAMARPRPGFLWGEMRRRVVAHRGRVHFAHADASGLSLFEEACDRGVQAAEAVLRRLS